MTEARSGEEMADAHGQKCSCGCGKTTGLAPRTSKRKGWVKGEPLNFIRGHGPRGKKPWNFKGTTTLRGWYTRVHAPCHPRTHKDGYVFEHILVAERVLGMSLPPGAEIHHVNGVKSDNRPGNLVVCQDSAYHQLLHKRQQALMECGNASWRKCSFCHAFDDPSNMYVGKEKAFHRKCRNDYSNLRAPVE